MPCRTVPCPCKFVSCYATPCHARATSYHDMPAALPLSQGEEELEMFDLENEEDYEKAESALFVSPIPSAHAFPAGSD